MAKLYGGDFPKDLLAGFLYGAVVLFAGNFHGDHRDGLLLLNVGFESYQGFLGIQCFRVAQREVAFEPANG